MAERTSVTQDDVALLAGVSRSVVSYVLNNGPRKVSQETRQRVLSAIEELGYRPNEHAQRLKQGSDAVQNAIGIVTGGKGYNLMERPYYNIILSGIYDNAYQLNQQISFLVYWEALKNPIFFNKHIHEQEVSGLIFVLPSFILQGEDDEKLLRQVMERVPNIICLEETLLDLPAVIFDRAEAARTAVSHLIGLGHQRIALIGIHDERVRGYKQALMEHHLPYDEQLVTFLEPAAPPVESAYALTTQLLASKNPFTAIFTATDEAAIGTMAAIQDHGMRVPHDIAIASMDNIEIAEMIRPALTTVDIPKRTLARLAVQSLMTQKDFADQRQVSILVPTQLIVRDSCGAGLNRDR
ncbi:MAG: LacI family transcriptional regulator [Anaerolineae bacterium]|nr:LacI family transcriptional regulator [Anaerolineae bacterium]